MAATFEPNREGILAAHASHEMSNAMVRRAVKGQNFAKSIAPVDTGRYKFGAFYLTNRTDPGGHRRRKVRGNFEKLPENDQGGFKIERFATTEGHAAARVVNATAYARFLEFGTRRMRAQHILGRSLDAMR
jgi:HK97 gp10 family phage protein